MLERRAEGEEALRFYGNNVLNIVFEFGVIFSLTQTSHSALPFLSSKKF